MKTSKLKNVAWAFFVLALASSTAFAQGRNKGDRNWNQSKGSCVNKISGLSEEQKTQLTAMDEKHWEMMDELRTKRRSTTDAVAKSEVWTTMLKSVEAHRNAVKSLLSDEQQKQFELLHANAGSGCDRNQNVENGRGNKAVRSRGQGNNCDAGKSRAAQRGARGGGACRL